MNRIQIIGLVLIFICGAISQLTDLKYNDTAVYILAGGTILGIILVISDWLSPKKDKK